MSTDVNWEKFYSTLQPPQNVEAIKQQINDFYSQHKDKKIAVVTVSKSLFL